MVLPPPVADHESGALAPVARIRRLLKLGQSGTLLLAVGDEAWVGRLWRGLGEAGPVHAAPDIPALAQSPEGALVLFGARPEDAGWLNRNRPFFAEAQLRVVVLADPRCTLHLRDQAKDFYDWFSHTVRLPVAPHRHVCANLEAGLRDRIGWRGAGLGDALGWVTSAPLREVDAARPWAAWVTDRDFEGVLAVRGVTTVADADWVRRASGGRGGMVFLDPGDALPVANAAALGWREASARVGGALAAALDLEAEAVEWLTGRVQEVSSAEDPAAELARRDGWTGGALGRRAFPVDAVATVELPPTLEGVQQMMSSGQTAQALTIAEHSAMHAAGQERARWLLLACDSLVALGRSREAITHAEAARMVLRQLVEAEPERADYQRDLSVSYNTLGDIRSALGDVVEARRLYEGGLDITLRLAERSPDQADYQRDLSISYERLGDIHLALGHGVEAKRLYESGLAIARGLAEQEPDRADYQRALFVCYSRLGEMHRTLGEGGEAMRLYSSAHDICLHLAAQEPDRADYQREMSVSYRRLGDIHRALGQVVEAKGLYAIGYDIARGLAEREPDRADYQRDLFVSYNLLGDTHRALGHRDEAKRLYENGLDIVRRLAEQEPDLADYQRDLYVSYNRLGDIHRGLGHGVEAKRLYGSGLDIARRLAEQEPDRAVYRRDLSVAYNKLGDTHLALGEVVQARRLYETGFEIARRLAESEPDRADYQRDLALSHERLAAVDPDAAGAWLGQAVQIRRRVLGLDPDSAVLQRELALTLLQHGRATQTIEAFNEGANLLVDLRRRGALEAWYWPLADTLIAHLGP